MEIVLALVLLRNFDLKRFHVIFKVAVKLSSPFLTAVTKTLGKDVKCEISQITNFSEDYTLFFFYLGFLSQPFTNHRTAGER